MTDDAMEQARELDERIAWLNPRFRQLAIADALRTARAQADAECAVMYELLDAHHRHHLQKGTIGLPNGKGGWFEIDNAAEYVESSLYEQTVVALAFPGAAKVAEVLQAARLYRQTALEGPADYEFDRLCDAVARLDGKDQCPTACSM